MSRARLILLALLALSTGAPAAAAPWGAAGRSKGGKHDERADKLKLQRAEYIRRGDELMVAARDSITNMAQQPGVDYQGDADPIVLGALDFYDQALAIEADADLDYRAFHAAARMLYVEDATRWKRMLRYFDQFRGLAPRDPRESTMLPELCTALSKLGGLGGPDADAYFDRGVAEYDTWRQRIDDTDPRFGDAMATYSTNAAELLMARGPEYLDRAIEYYETGITYAPYIQQSASTKSLAYYGAAVAYDRDGQWGKASEMMGEALALDQHGQPNFRNKNGIHTMGQLSQPNVYFVPTGDIEYYFALGYHVQGQPKLALEHYLKFLQLLPDSPYAQRAKDHIAELGGSAP